MPVSTQLLAAVERSLKELKGSRPQRRCRFDQGVGKYVIEHREKVKGGAHHGAFEWVGDAQLADVGELADYLGVHK